MKSALTTVFVTCALLAVSSCNHPQETEMTQTAEKTTAMKPDSTSGYAPVNGLNMYYEIHGKGMPLVLVHGGGSTIQTSFGQVLDLFAKDRQVIAVELQGHGRTNDRKEPETFEQDADDVAALLHYLKIEKADFFGFSNGGQTCMELSMRHPELVRKMVLGSTFYKRDGAPPQLWESLRTATLKDMPQPLQDAYKKVAADPNGLQNMFEKDRQRMINFTGWKAEAIHSINAPVFIIIGDADVVLPEHALEMSRLMPHARLAILPGGHGAYIGEIMSRMEHSKIPALTVAMIEEFLEEPFTTAH